MTAASAIPAARRRRRDAPPRRPLRLRPRPHPPLPAESLAAPAEAHVSVQKQCGAEYQAAKAAGSLNGETWQQFLQACRTRHAAPAAAAPAAPAPAPVAAPAAPPPAPVAAPAAEPAAPATGRRRPREPRHDEERQARQPWNTGVHRSRESLRRRVARQEGRAAEGQSQSDLARLPQRMQQAAEGSGALRASLEA